MYRDGCKVCDDCDNVLAECTCDFAMDPPHKGNSMFNLGLDNIDVPPLPDPLRWRIRAIVALLATVFIAAIGVALGCVWFVAGRAGGNFQLVLYATVASLILLSLILYALLLGVFKITGSK